MTVPNKQNMFSSFLSVFLGEDVVLYLLDQNNLASSLMKEIFTLIFYFLSAAISREYPVLPLDC